jgi:hypothetical protein
MLSAALGKTEHRAKGLLWVTPAINTETLKALASALSSVAWQTSPAVSSRNAIIGLCAHVILQRSLSDDFPICIKPQKNRNISD